MAIIMKFQGIGSYLLHVCGWLGKSARGISALWVTFAVALLLAPAETRAQEERPWRRDGTISLRSIYDGNVFRLTDSQKNNIGSGSGKYADMEGATDLILQVGVGGELRHGPSSRRMRIGGGATVDAYTTNTRRTHMTLDAYLARSFSSRDELKVKVEVTPSEFRRNYLGGGDAVGSPLYQEGVSTSFGGEVAYARRLIGGSGPDLDLEIGFLGTSRSVDVLSWRDRSSMGGWIEFDLKINSDIDMKVEVSRSRASYTSASQPVLDLGLVTLETADKDFNDTRFGGEGRFDLGSDARLTLEYERRMRTFLAELGVDPVYGGREDARNAYGAEIEYEISNRVEMTIGGKYQQQVTFRPAGGSTGDEIDYNRAVATFQLAYRR